MSSTSSPPSSSSSQAILPCIGRVVVLVRGADGVEKDGGALQFETEELVFGRDATADVRI